VHLEVRSAGGDVPLRNERDLELNENVCPRCTGAAQRCMSATHAYSLALSRGHARRNGVGHARTEMEREGAGRSDNLSRDGGFDGSAVELAVALPGVPPKVSS
jgi:hypothetical protein